MNKTEFALAGVATIIIMVIAWFSLKTKIRQRNPSMYCWIKAGLPGWIITITYLFIVYPQIYF